MQKSLVLLMNIFLFYSRTFSSVPHLAASPRDVEMAGIIESLWKQYGFEVELPTYEVLLSYPKKNSSNKVQIINDTGHPIYEVNYSFVYQYM